MIVNMTIRKSKFESNLGGLITFGRIPFERDFQIKVSLVGGRLGGEAWGQPGMFTPSLSTLSDLCSQILRDFKISQVLVFYGSVSHEHTRNNLGEGSHPINANR